MPGAFPPSSRPHARRLTASRVDGASGRVAGNPACGVVTWLVMISRPGPAGKRGPPLPDFRGQARSAKRLIRKTKPVREHARREAFPCSVRRKEEDGRGTTIGKGDAGIVSLVSIRKRKLVDLLDSVWDFYALRRKSDPADERADEMPRDSGSNIAVRRRRFRTSMRLAANGLTEKYARKSSRRRNGAVGKRKDVASCRCGRNDGK